MPKFQSTLPARGATGPTGAKGDTGAFQSTLPARGATDADVCVCTDLDISIHAPREGSDSLASSTISLEMEFQSTLPARGATRPDHHCGRAVRHFNPRSPRGERRRVSLRRAGLCNFNPRSPRGERQQNVLKYRREFWVKRQLIKQNWET